MTTTTSTEGHMSFLAAAEQLLREADGPLHIRTMTEQIIDRGMVDTSGKTPAATLAALLLTGVKRGQFVKTDRATFDLKVLNPRGRKTRPQS